MGRGSQRGPPHRGLSHGGERHRAQLRGEPRRGLEHPGHHNRHRRSFKRRRHDVRRRARDGRLGEPVHGHLEQNRHRQPRALAVQVQFESKANFETRISLARLKGLKPGAFKRRLLRVKWIRHVKPHRALLDHHEEDGDCEAQRGALLR
jgi:hypothetical protein